MLFLLLFSFVSGQIDDIRNIGENLESGADKTIDKASILTNENSQDFLTGQWKEFLLKNKIVSGFNDFFEKIDIVFLILFGRHWEISLQMFFTFLIWLFTVLFLSKFMLFFESGIMRLFGGLLATIVLAQLKVFKFLGDFIFNAIYFKDGILWTGIAWTVTIVLFGLYLKLGKFISRMIEKKKEKDKKEKIELGEKKIEAITEGFED